MAADLYARAASIAPGEEDQIRYSRQWRWAKDKRARSFDAEQHAARTRSAERSPS